MLVQLCDAEAQDLDSPSLETFVGRMTDRETNWRTKEITQSLFFRAGNIEGAQAYHRNYMEYLESAWGSHQAIRLTPDIVWYTLLCELTQIVAADPEKFRHLFSDSDGTQDIIVITDEMVVMPIDQLIGMLEKLVPTDTDTFLPQFSTSTDRSRHAFHAAFCDMVSPYYSYEMLLCGIPAIEVLGTKEDWARVRDCWVSVKDKVLADHSDYHGRISTILNAIVSVVDKPDTEFWKNIFYLERCGSGHQTEAFGWFTELFLESPSPRYAQNFSSHVSLVKYKQLNTGKDYEMKVGLFTSNVENGILVPDFGYAVYEKTEPVVEEGASEPEFTTTVIQAEPRKLKTKWTAEAAEEAEFTTFIGDDVDANDLLMPGLVLAPYVPGNFPAVVNGEEVEGEFGATADFDPNAAESEILGKYGDLVADEDGCIKPGMYLAETDVVKIAPPADDQESDEKPE